MNPDWNVNIAELIAPRRGRSCTPEATHDAPLTEAEQAMLHRLGTVESAKPVLSGHLDVIGQRRFDDEFVQHWNEACHVLVFVDEATRGQVVSAMARILCVAPDPVKAMQPAKVLWRFSVGLPRGHQCRTIAFCGAASVVMRAGLGRPEALSMVPGLLVALDPPPEDVNIWSMQASAAMLDLLKSVLVHCERTGDLTVLVDHVDFMLSGVIALLPGEAATLRAEVHRMASTCTQQDATVALALLEAESALRLSSSNWLFVAGMEGVLQTLCRLTSEPGATAADVPMRRTARLLWNLQQAMAQLHPLPGGENAKWMHQITQHLIRVMPDCPRAHLLMLEGPREFDGTFVHHWREAFRTLNVADEEALSDDMEKIATASEMVLHAVPHDLGARQVLLQLLAAFDTPRDESAQSVARSHVMRDLLEGVLYHVESANDGTVLLDFAGPLKTAVRALVPGDARGIRRELLEQMASRCTVPDVRQVLESLAETAREREQPAALRVLVQEALARERARAPARIV